jgi:hypothetical protein
MTTVREILETAADKCGSVTVYKTFLNENLVPHTFTSVELAEQWIKEDMYNDIQMNMAPNVEINVNVVNALRFDVTVRKNSYVDDRNDSKG